MNWSVWEEIEAALRRHDVRPILAVVPDNRDSKLIVDPPRGDFWDRVRTWQAMGYTIALHGHQHRYVNRQAGLMGLTQQSEFAGLPRAEQEAKLRAGLAIFAEQGVCADAWVAPAHSFDATTTAALADLGFKVISDGLSPWPYEDRHGITWIPQQLWNFRKKPNGVWTVCLHHNSWSAAQCARFAREIASYASRMTDVATVTREFAGRRRTLRDCVIASADLWWNHRLRPVLGRAQQRLQGRGG